MIIRQKFGKVWFHFHKELLLVFLISFSLLSGIIHPHHNSSQGDSKRSVKGEMTRVTVPDHVKELEIIPAKYERLKITPAADSPRKWGPARKIDTYTYTMDVTHDDQMASAAEIVSALNLYRQSKGVGSLQNDQTLTGYAQGRADFFASRNAMDSHAGFQDFINNQNGFNQLGFFSLGENSSLGYKLNGTNLIEKVFAGDTPHDMNQLSSQWTHVGVGVNGLAVDIIFGGRKQ